MQKKRKLIIPALAATFIICVAAYSFLSRVTFDINSLAPRIIASAQAQTGYRLSVENLQVRLLPSPDITITGLSASNGTTATLKSRIVKLRLALLPLLARRAVVRYIDIEDAALDITTSELERLAKSGNGHGRGALIESLDIRNLKLKLVDDASADGKTVDADISEAYVGRLDDDFVIRLKGTTRHGAQFSSNGNWQTSKNSVVGRITIQGVDLEKLSLYLNPDETAFFKGAADADLSYSIGSSTDLSGTVTLTGVETRISGTTVKPLHLDGSARITATIEQKSYKVSLNDIRLDLGGFVVSGALDAAGTGPDATFTVSASTTPISLNTLKGLTPERLLPAAFAQKFTRIGSLGGTAAFEEIYATGEMKNRRIDARRLADKLRVRIKLERAGLHYPGLSESFRDVSGIVGFKEMTVTASDLEADYGGIRLLNLSAVISKLDKRPRYEISLKGIFDAGECARLAADIGEETTGLADDLTRIKLSGDVNISLNIKGELGGKGASVYSGSARLRDVKAVAADGSSVLGPAHGLVSFDNEHVNINKISAFAGDSSLEITGAIEDYASKTPSFDISASAVLTNETIKGYILKRAPDFAGRLNVKARARGSLDGFSTEAAIETGAGQGNGIAVSNGSIKAERIRYHTDEPAEIGAIEVKVPNGLIYGHVFKDLSASGSVTKETVDGNVRLIIDKGEATASTRYYRDKADLKYFDADINLNGVMLDEIIASFGVKNKVISGPVYGKAALSGMRGAKDFTSSLNGVVNLRADKGRLYKFLVLSRIFSIINIISIDELFKEGLPFKTVAGDFTITDGVLATKTFYLDSDSMRMSAVGRIDMNAPDIESFLAVRPFVTLDKIISKVPLAGWAITGKEGSLVSFYYEISGPLGDPDVSPAPIKGMQKDIPGILERFVAPPDILDIKKKDK